MNNIDNTNNININKLKNIKAPEIKKNKSFIINTVDSIYTTITDYLTTFLGINTFTNMQYNAMISSKMTSLFRNTKINVYVYDSKIPNAFTIPGAPEIDPFLLKLLFLSVYFPILGSVLNLIINIMQTSRLLKNIKTDSLVYDASSNKLISTITEVTCYISSSLIQLMDSDDEIIAILLHEVGHNTMVLANMIDSLMRITFGGYTIDEIIKLIINNDENMSTWQSILKYIIISIIVTYFLNYLRRRQEIYADEFAIKCGYGIATESAIKKIHNYEKTSSFFTSIKKSLSFNFFDKLLQQLNSIFFIIYDNTFGLLNFGTYPQSNRREKLIHDKTEKFNNNHYKTVDRTAHLGIAL